MSIVQKNSQILHDFKKSLISFLDELVETFPKECEFISMRILVKDQLPIQIIMDSFIEDIDNVKTQVNKKDENFFIKGNAIFSKIGKESIFKKLWESPEMTQCNKEETWKWFEQFVLFAERYLENISNY